MCLMSCYRREAFGCVGPKVHQQHKELRAQEEDRRSHHGGDKPPAVSLGENTAKT